MENDSSDRVQGDKFQDEGSIAEEEQVQPSLSHDASLQTNIKQASLTEKNSEDMGNQKEIQATEQRKDEKIEMHQNLLSEEEAIYSDAWNLSLEHANATYQSSTSFTSSIMDSERSNVNRHRESNASERLHQHLQRQSLLSDEANKKDQLFQFSAGGEQIANSIIREKEQAAGLKLRPSPSGGTTTWQPQSGKHGVLSDLEQPSAIPLGGRTVSSSASTEPPPPPDLNRRSNYHRPSQPGAVAMVGHQLQANLPVETLDDRTIQVGIEGSQEEDDDDKGAASPLVDAVLVPDEVVEAPTSPQQSVAATTAVPMDGNDMPRWGLRDRRVICVICVICVLVSIIAGLALGLSLVFLQNNQEETSILTSSPTFSPSAALAPTASPTSRKAMLQTLLSKYVSDVTPWENVYTTQYQALDWLANGDMWRPLDTDVDDIERAIVERYSMLVMYFSFDGPSWREDESFVDLSHPVCSWQLEHCHSVGECEIHGVLCEEQFVTGIVVHLGEIDIVGTIPTEIGLLSSLSTFLVENTTLYGELPEELFLLPELESVSIVDCALSGTLPKNLLQAPALSWLNLQGNRISGTMENAANPGLLALDLGSNQFTGPLPNSLSNELYYLDVSNNPLLSGTVPSSYSKLSLTNLFVEGTSLSDIERVFCGTGLLDYEEFYADCGGSRPQILCRCCTHCCDDTDCFPN